MTDRPEFHLFLPQMRLSPEALIERAQAAEAAGFTGIALMDHLAPPAAFDQPMFEAMTTATWLAARTEKLIIGHLVLCDSFRHPAVLARQSVTLDHLSGGRFELAIGSGSVPQELVAFGVTRIRAVERSARLRESLEILTRLWTGEVVTYQGEYFELQGARQLPMPTRPIPITIGGTSEATLELVRTYATWWNVPTHHAERLEERRSLAGTARVSLQQMVTFIPNEQDRHEIVALADRRFGWMEPSGRILGTGPELVAKYEESRRLGVDRFYVWFSDFADLNTVSAFGAQVIDQMV